MRSPFFFIYEVVYNPDTYESTELPKQSEKDKKYILISLVEDEFESLPLVRASRRAITFGSFCELSESVWDFLNSLEKNMKPPT